MLPGLLKLLRMSQFKHVLRMLTSKLLQEGNVTNPSAVNKVMTCRECETPLLTGSVLSRKMAGDQRAVRHHEHLETRITCF